MGILSCPIMLIQILADYLGLKILEALYQSNQELDTSLSSGMFLSYGYQNFKLEFLF